MPSQRRRRRHVREPALTLADEWRVWVIDNLLRGADPETLVGALRDRQVPSALARREVTALAGSPALAACRHYQRRAAQLEQVVRLGRQMAREAARPDRVERRARVEADEFFDRYWAGNVPVVLTEMIHHWRALSTWSPADFRRRFADVEVEAAVGRESDPDYDMNVRDHSVTMTMAELIDGIEASGHSNDIYMVANNRAMDRGPLAELLDDIDPDEGLFDTGRYDGSVSLWVGPGGTVTPLHHDTTNIFFCQIYGRKRVRLLPPSEVSLLEGARGFYTRAELADPDWVGEPALQDAVVKTVDLGPGDALFIPAGWWHHVQSLEVSISFSLLNFRRPNVLDWYRPGDPESRR